MVTVLVLSLFVFVTSYSDVLCQSFTGLSGGVCPGGSATFICVADPTITWTVTPGGTNDICTYSFVRQTDTCGPRNMFMSSRAEDGGTNSSTLSVESVDSDLNETNVKCDNGSTVIGNSTICIINVLESPEIHPASVSGLGDEDNMCRLSLEWSEAVVSCAGSVTYTLSATPCLSVSRECEVVGGRQTTSTTETQITLPVDGSVGLEYNFTVSTCANTSAVYSVDLTATSTGNGSFYYYEYNNEMLTIEFINVTWPRYFVLDSEALYRVVIDEQTFTITAADNCREEMCTFIHNPGLFEPPSVAVDIFGCTTEKIVPMDISSTICSPADLLSPDMDQAPIITNGQGVYSFPGGNVTYNGVSLGSTATYKTTVDYLVNGNRTLESVCRDGSWFPEVNITKAECDENDLLLLRSPIHRTGENMLCTDGNTLCTSYTGIAIGSTATYTTSDGYCIMSNSPVKRKCLADLTWSGDTPRETEASERQQLSSANIALIIVGLILFIAGVAISIAVVVLSWPEKGATKNSQTEALRICCKCFVLCCCPCWVKCCVLLLGFSALFLAIVLPILEVAPWIAAFVYVATHTFTVNDGDYRKSDSLCESPIGKIATRDGRFILSFVSLLIFLFWLDCLVYLLYKRYCAKDPLKSPGAEEPLEMGETYDVIQRNQPSSKPTQKLLSETDPSYGKLDKSKMQSEEPGHYGKLDRTGNKKTATIAPAVGAEYGKLDRTQMQPEEPGHYGKLDRGGKTSTLPVAVTGSDEYGKLDRSQMENPLHYGKLDHPGKKGATLTGGVAPTDTQGYGKLDKTQMQASGSTGGGGEMYDTVSHEPRHQLPSTKSKRQHSSSGH